MFLKGVRGYTLIETLIVLGIMSITISYALYYFLHNLSHTKNNLLADDLVHHLQYARSEAIKRNQIVGVCGMEDTQSCSSNWDKGYLIYTKTHPQSSHQEIIKVHQYTDTDSSITSTLSLHAKHIQFAPSGRAYHNGRITIQPTSCATPYTIFISLTGRIHRT